MKELIRLFVVFAKIGLFTFGGGAAMMALLHDELVKKKKWITEQDLLDFFAIAQCTPGIIAVNTATIVGYKMKKSFGAAAATVGVVFPSIVIIVLIAAMIQNFMDNQYIVHIFNGIRAAVVAIIANVVIALWRKNIKNYWQILIFVFSMVCLLCFSVSPAIVVVFGCLLGLFTQFMLLVKDRSK
ncbi:MAG: chromate transporter [Alphaproteobacteria bacterium]|nr:chromate transporter [Alphaproteobacteria bacterium]